MKKKKKKKKKKDIAERKNAKETYKKKSIYIRGCIQKFPDWPPGARTANGTALCH
jgi:hypothetical protein